MAGDPQTHRTVLAAPDAFKGTATAALIADAVAAGSARAGWSCDRCPLSDGGEGFAEVMAGGAGRPGEWRSVTVTGPLGSPVTARFWLAGSQAVLESAAASGLPLAGGPAGNDPVAATSRGTGELIVAAVAAGARRVLVGVGGSATTDGGWGAIEAIEASGGTKETEVVVACDVDTVFVDAAERFGPQKGASPGQVVELHTRLVGLAADLRARYGVDVGAIPGSGAAGGLAGGLAALGARLVPGFEVVASAVDLAARLSGAELVVTGEGCLDATSWSGKVVGGVVRLARRAGVPVWVVAGSLGPGGTAPIPASGRDAASPVGEATATPGQVFSLSERCGPGRARADPSGCTAEVVYQALMALV